MTTEVTVVGGGLAGTEAAFQLAERGFTVRLFEMKPHRRTPAQIGDGLAELVCSNSLRGASLSNAVGLLKEEMRRLGSLMMRIADETSVPAGGALAVDRDLFSAGITKAIEGHSRIIVERRELDAIPAERPVILATGPLTTDALAESIAKAAGISHLAYYDAISPIVTAESLDWSVVFKQSRYDKGGDAAYINCPFDQDQYQAFVQALCSAEKVAPREFEKVKYFEGCLPCEVMAERGPQTLSFGPMKPVGLIDPRTERRPHAVVQLRAEDHAATAYNLVGFQTRMKYGEQDRVFRMIPGLAQAEFLRFGSVHRNTFVNAPTLLDETFQLRATPGVYLAGQVTGVEGYVESAASGLLAGIFLAKRLRGEAIPLPPETTALGGLCTHLKRNSETYQPSNITWACIPPLEGKRTKLRKRERYEALSQRALVDFDAWRPSV